MILHKIALSFRQDYVLVCYILGIYKNLLSESPLQISKH